MTSFIVIASIITLVILFYITAPLRKKNNATSEAAINRQQQNIELARKKKLELEQQYEQGSIDQATLEKLLNELTISLADDIDGSSSGSSSNAQLTTNTSQNSKVLLVGTIVLIPLLATAIYLKTGTPRAMNQIAVTSPHEQLGEHDVQTMLAKLEQHLVENPSDQDAWQILARTHLASGRLDDAAQALKKLLALTGGGNADLHAKLADTLALANKGLIDNEVKSHIDAALQLQPMHPQALWLAGLAEMQAGNMPAARTHWNILLPLLEDMPQQKSELTRIIEQSYSQEQSVQEQSANKITSQASTEVASDTTTIDTTDNGISAYVTLDSSIAAKADPQDLIFVIVKAQQGPPAPLAVKRLQVKDLPATIRLSDADAMLPQMAISKFENISVTARVSKSGDPIARAGDLQSEAINTTNTTTEKLSLSINKVLP